MRWSVWNKKWCANIVRLSTNPYIFLGMTCIMVLVVLIPGVIQSVRGDRNAMKVVAFLVAICGVELLIGFIASRTYCVIADDDVICVRKNKQTYTIPWSSVYECIWLSQDTKILIRYSVDNQKGEITCYGSKKRITFVQKCIIAHGIRTNGLPSLDKE